jgi:hypothetical protein
MVHSRIVRTSVLIALLAPPALAAQRVPTAADTIRAPAAPTPGEIPATPRRIPASDSPSGAFLGAAAAGTLGLFVGAGLARITEPCRGCEAGWDRVSRGLQYGWTLGLPLGAHAGNGRRGSLAADVAGSLAAMGIWRAIARRSDSPNVVLLPLLQLGAVVGAERLTGQGRPPRDSITVRR